MDGLNAKLRPCFKLLPNCWIAERQRTCASPDLALQARIGFSLIGVAVFTGCDWRLPAPSVDLLAILALDAIRWPILDRPRSIGARIWRQVFCQTGVNFIWYTLLRYRWTVLQHSAVKRPNGEKSCAAFSCVAIPTCFFANNDGPRTPLAIEIQPFACSVLS